MASSWASRRPRFCYNLTGATPRILCRAAQIIDKPTRYTNVASAQCASGGSTFPTSRKAVRWSAAGSIFRATRMLRLSADARYWAISALDNGARWANLPSCQSAWNFDQAHQALLLALESHNWVRDSDVLVQARRLTENCQNRNGNFHDYLRSRYPHYCFGEPNGFNIYLLVTAACYDIGGEQDDDHDARKALDRASKDMGHESIDQLYEALGERGLSAALDWAIEEARFHERYRQPLTWH